MLNYIVDYVVANWRLLVIAGIAIYYAHKAYTLEDKVNDLKAELRASITKRQISFITPPMNSEIENIIE